MRPDEAQDDELDDNQKNLAGILNCPPLCSPWKPRGFTRFDTPVLDIKPYMLEFATRGEYTGRSGLGNSGSEIGTPRNSVLGGISMSSRTVFLGRLIGLYCILVSLAMLIRKQASVNVLTAMLHNAQLLLSLGVITVIAGLAMVLSHNVWSGGAVTVIVTLIGWIALIKGALLLFLSPEAELSLFLDTLHLEQFFYLYLGGMLLLGIYLTYQASRRATR